MKDVASNTEQKKAAALKAAELVKSGQKVGLGTGSTAAFVIQELGRRAKEENLQIECVTTSFQSMNIAISSGLKVFPVQALGFLDISIDGADEIDPSLNLIKGGGAAHTLEKIVHASAKQFVVVADDSKLVDQLGSKFYVPVEVIPYAITLVEQKLKDLGASEVVLRNAVKKDGPIVTDNGNFVFDAKFNISDPIELEAKINSIPGVVENGIFSKNSGVVPERAIIAADSGVTVKTR